MSLSIRLATSMPAAPGISETKKTLREARADQALASLAPHEMTRQHGVGASVRDLTRINLDTLLRV